MYTGPKIESTNIMFAVSPGSPRSNPAGIVSSPQITDIVSGIQMTKVGTNIPAALVDGVIGLDNPTIANASYWRTPSLVSITTGVPYSLSMWAKFTASSGPSAHSGLGFHSHGQNSGLEVSFRQITTTDIRIGCSTGTGSVRTYNVYYGTSNLYQTGWHLLTLVSDPTDANRLELYVDGVLEKSTTYAQYNIDSYIALFLWSVTYTSTSYRDAFIMGDGWIQQHALTDADVLANFNSTKYRYYNG